MRTAAIILLLVSLHGQAQVLGPQATLDTSRIRIGEQTMLMLEVPYRSDAGQGAIGWPMIGDTLTAHVRVVTDAGIDSVIPDPQDDPFAMVLRRRLTITSFDSGFWAIPPFAFVQDGDTVGTEPLLLTVETVPVDTAAGFRDIKDIAELPFSWRYWWKQNWPYVAGAAGLIAVLAFVVWRLRNRPVRTDVPEPVTPPLPLHERVLQALDDLERRRLWQDGQVKEHHSELTDILRGYIEERYGVPALERTTDELLGELRVSPMTRDAQESLGNLLRLADLVKFAKYTALPAENEQALRTARELVVRTRPQPSHAPRP